MRNRKKVFSFISMMIMIMSCSFVLAVSDHVISFDEPMIPEPLGVTICRIAGTIISYVALACMLVGLVRFNIKVSKIKKQYPTPENKKEEQYKTAMSKSMFELVTLFMMGFVFCCVYLGLYICELKMKMNTPPW